MSDPIAHLELVRKAISSGLSNCVEWIDDQAQLRVRDNPDLQGLTPRGIKQLVIDWVANRGGEIFQRREERENWRDDRDYWCFVLIQVAGMNRPLFVEIILTDDDVDVPEVAIVNAHLSSE